MTKIMKTELVKFYASDGLELQGLLFRSGKNTDKLIIDVFGMTGDFFSMNHQDFFVKALKNSKFDIFFAGNRGLGVVFRFDKKGSEKSLYFGTAKERFTDCIHDIKGAINAMRRLGYKNIILQGSSTGCQKITYYQYKTKDKNVKALILLGAVDDHNIARKRARKNFSKLVKNAIKLKNKDDLKKEFWGYTAKRFLSYADLRNAEAQLFNYDSKMTAFSKITVPILAVFGSNDQHATKPIKEHLRILESKTNSKKFTSLIIKNANHSFEGKEKELSAVVLKWLEGVI